MILHIFNPEHDLALAANLSNFTAPRAARLLRQQLGWLPALWAEEDDLILVDDVRTAQDAYGQLGGRGAGIWLFDVSCFAMEWKLYLKRRL